MHLQYKHREPYKILRKNNEEVNAELCAYTLIQTHISMSMTSISTNNI